MMVTKLAGQITTPTKAATSKTDIQETSITETPVAEMISTDLIADVVAISEVVTISDAIAMRGTSEPQIREVETTTKTTDSVVTDPTEVTTKREDSTLHSTRTEATLRERIALTLIEAQSILTMIILTSKFSILNIQLYRRS